MVKMLSGRAIATVRRLQGQLFDAGLAMASPAESLTLRRYNRSTALWELIAAQAVLVRWMHDKGQARGLGTPMSTPLMDTPTALSGTFTALEPFDVRTGDRFTLEGVEGHVETVWPARNGRRRCGFVVDADVRTGP